jgi:hypothetical protein
MQFCKFQDLCNFSLGVNFVYKINLFQRKNNENLKTEELDNPTT